MFSRSNISTALFFICVLLCLSPWATAPLALFTGLVFALVFGNPFPDFTSKGTSFLLKVSVVGLGFGIHADKAFEAGFTGILFTLVSIAGTILLGFALGKWLKIETKTSHLISCGTAICGGSAIAAIAPVIKANQNQISMALGTVFILNAISLFIFPYIGEFYHLSQSQFGLWAAIAIHDTSSVVGAATKYGPDAVQIATTVKLARALWIIPIVFISALSFKKDSSSVSIPYFILFFFAAMLLNSYVPALAEVSSVLSSIAGKGVILTLFLIGSDLSVKTVRSVGPKPFFQGIILWLLISITSLWVIIKMVS